MAKTFEQQLVDLGAEKLAKLLADRSEYDTDLKKELKLLAVSNSPDKLAKAIKAQINQVKRSTRFYDWREVKVLENMLEMIRANIVEHLAPQDPKLAADMLELFVKLDSNVFERCDDSSGVMGSIFTEAVNDWGQAYRKVPVVDSKRFAEKIFKVFSNDDYGVRSGLIKAFGPVLKKYGLDELEGLVKASLEKADKYEKYSLESALCDIADIKDSVDEYIALIKKSAVNGVVHDAAKLEIAKRLNAKWRSKEAIEWLQSIPDRSFETYNKVKLLLEAFDLEGMVEEAQQLRWRTFSKTLDLSYFNEYIKPLTAAEVEKARVKAKDIIIASSNTLRAMEVLLELGFVEEAKTCLSKYYQKIDGDSYYSIRPIIKHFVNADCLLEANLLLRKLVDGVLAKAVSKYYPYAVKDLLKSIELAKSINDWCGFPSQEKYIEELKIRHKLKKSFWSKLPESI